MAIVKAFSVISAAALDAVNLAWTEIALFMFAGLMYVAFSRFLPKSRAHRKSSASLKTDQSQSKTALSHRVVSCQSSRQGRAVRPSSADERVAQGMAKIKACAREGDLKGA
eukprot:CAMPEP_0170595708 /NCGR_PEP_ID=MMETSP0224-20130122/14711_1 /TAXON_ID=285029 /ORGANISM="Togula jolla, Strain CCCM 725" /LENGTH=110 /DNA_ID=CAMNT_0010919917 /DNA_START=88 /DNA_END=416 /DNA_ORIENTATION=+